MSPGEDGRAETVFSGGKRASASIELDFVGSGTSEVEWEALTVRADSTIGSERVAVEENSDREEEGCAWPKSVEDLEEPQPNSERDRVCCSDLNRSEGNPGLRDERDIEA